MNTDERLLGLLASLHSLSDFAYGYVDTPLPLASRIDDLADELSDILGVDNPDGF